MDTSCVFVMSYELLSKKAEEVSRAFIGTAIMDESHCLKNHKSARFQVIQAK